ncbi:MAG: Gfo/Idh/MocA family protein [Planctomycetota bacterium]
MRTPSRNRRQFGLAGLRAAGGAMLAGLGAERMDSSPVFAEEAGARKVAASDRINVGIVGLGARGFNLLDDLLRMSDVEIRILCDLQEVHHRELLPGEGRAYGRETARQTILDHRKRQGKSQSDGIDLTADFREVCERPDLDAVIVATPDHWHALCCLSAMEAGKDVYCEKPVTHWFSEGLRICRAVEERSTVFQVGSQQRSDWRFRRAAELARNGLLGKIERVEVGLPPGYPQPQSDPAITDPPPELNYDLWCGPAPMLPYTRARHHRWWRGHRAFGGGVLMDWIGHHNDIAHWALDMDRSGPISVEAVDWQFPTTDLYNTPSQYAIRCEYPGEITSSISSQHTEGLKIIGADGWVWVDRGRMKASTPEWTERDFEPGALRLEVSTSHMANFIECVKSRGRPITPAETGHRSITPGHLGYVAHELGRKVRWDPIHQTIIDDQQADALLRSGSYRAPW